MSDRTPITNPALPPTVRRPDFASNYANNARFESTVYDLRVIFGQSDLSSGSETIDQHTAVTLPWPFVKVLLYYLQVQLIGQETQNGPVVIPPSQIPQPFEPPAEYASDPVVQRGREAINKFREQFIAALNEAARPKP